ncbi:MAG: hypothetical protein OQK75_03340 [Gammaproteobacteria bacterium]|nr:hypothetical protein [Gammaproteobacteria bacterium]MCW8986683.1 hypothetical protein [Gammaproteobacteria bacterium]MCW9031540.1 hypothetical protein [Gammaproteobacteria bacterium]
MRKVFILMLFALNMVYFNHAIASSNIDQSVIYNEEGKPEEGKDGGKKDGKKGGDKKNPEEDCE